MRRSVCLCLIALLAASLLPGCGVVIRQYVYPPALDLGLVLRGYLYESVNAEGYTAELTENSVDFQYNSGTQVRYLLNPGFSLAIITDGSDLTKDELEAHFASTRARAEEILAIARARVVPTHPSTTASAPEPPSEARPETQPAPTLVNPPPPATGACRQLADCYAALATAFCESRDREEPCPFKLTVEMEAGADQICQKMLHNIPFMVSPFAAENPEFLVPAGCVSRGR